MEKKKITFDIFIRGIIFCVIFVGLMMLTNRLSGVLLPFFIAWLIAYMVYPLVKFFQYKLYLKNRVVSIFCALLVITAVGVGFFFLVVPPMIAEFSRVNHLLFTYLTQGLTHSSKVPETLSQFISENVDIKAIENFFNENGISDTIKNAIPRLWTILSDSVSFLFNILASFIILLYVVFILLDYEKLSEGWVNMLPKRYRRFTVGLTTDLQNGMNTYFRGQALVALIVGILFSIGFLIIDFPLAIGLGLLIGALNMVPYLQILGFIPTIMLAILKAAETGQNFWIIMAAATAVFAIVQILQDAIITPRIMGKITGLNPAIILLSLSVWGSLMGIIGMIIALPLTTLMISYYKRFIINNERITDDEIFEADNQAHRK